MKFKLDFSLILQKAFMEKFSTVKKECDEFATKIEDLQIEARQKKPLIEAVKIIQD